MEILAFYAIAIEPIKVQTHSASQNDCLNLSFVKDRHVAGKKMARYGHYMAIYQLLFFGLYRTCTWPQVTSEAITLGPIKI